MVEQFPVGEVEILDNEVHVDLEVVLFGTLVDLAPQDGLPHAPGFLLSSQVALVKKCQKIQAQVIQYVFGNLAK